MDTVSLTYASVFVFVFGAIVGSLLNVCILRLPLEKSVLWPSSRCATCLTPIRFHDNLPLLSYWIVGGRCRACKAGFSARYFLIELCTALLFVGLFWIEVGLNWQQVPYLDKNPFSIFRGVPWVPIVMFLHHATLFSLLLAAAVCDLDRREIPLSLTVPGTLLGLVLATLLPWPWPSQPADCLPQLPAPQRAALLHARDALEKAPNPRARALLEEEVRDLERIPWEHEGMGLKLGLYPWPVWGPLPDWLYGSPLLGLMTGLAGALVGSGLLRAVKFLFEKGLGREALGLGDADLMMMAGAFLGWQPVVAAFFIGALVALVLAVPQKLLSTEADSSLPFGPGLALGTLVTWLFWRAIGPPFQVIFFYQQMLLILVVLGGGLIFLISATLGWWRRRRT
jgi:leader peptidase (prepilin peptidase) / N-methyltransferase